MVDWFQMATPKYTVKYGYHQDITRECDTWDQVKLTIKELHMEARGVGVVLERGDNLIVMGPNYDVGGPDEQVHWGLTEDEEQELGEMLMVEPFRTSGYDH